VSLVLGEAGARQSITPTPKTPQTPEPMWRRIEPNLPRRAQLNGLTPVGPCGEQGSHAEHHWSAPIIKGRAITQDSSRVLRAYVQDRALRPRISGDESIANAESRSSPTATAYVWLLTPQISASASTSTRDRPQPVSSRGVGVSLLTVWSRIKPGSRERGGRTTPQKGGNRCQLSMISDCTVCPSDSRFRPITKDLGRLREMPSFALSRRQRGFESRWDTRSSHV
jgi:hypothetical protein